MSFKRPARASRAVLPALATALAVAVTGCLDNALEGRLFPCSDDGDCLSGYECWAEPGGAQRFCLRKGSSVVADCQGLGCGEADAADDADAASVDTSDASDRDTGADGVGATDDDRDGITLEEGDCDDHDNTVGLPETWFLDADEDTYGDPESTFASCQRPPGYVERADDCDDSRSGVHPGAQELCNALNDDCDEIVDEDDAADAGTFCADADQDGFGDPSAPMAMCEARTGFVAVDTDCNDTDDMIHPNATETWYDGVDQNCDQANDFDQDGDGFDSRGADCDDLAVNVHPGAAELCNGFDDDCDGKEQPYCSIISAGFGAVCMVMASSQVQCWGMDTFGVASPPAGSFTQVSVGQYSACGLADLGAVVCWGEDDYGQVSGAPSGTFQAVSAGDDHACALDAAGEVQCWGTSALGQTEEPTGPFVALSVGGTHACVLDAAGNATCWGNSVAAPAETFRQIDAASGFTCGLRTDGTLLCWGADIKGRTQPPTGSSYTRIAAGSYHACALVSTGAVVCWGANDYGESTVPSGSFVDLTAGGAHTCAVAAAGDPTCWGHPAYVAGTP